MGRSWWPFGELGVPGIYKKQRQSWPHAAPIWIGAVGAILLAALRLFLCRSWRPLGSSFGLLGSLLAALNVGVLGILTKQTKSWTQMAPICIGAIGAILLAALHLLSCRSWRLFAKASVLASLGCFWRWGTLGRSVSARNKRSRGPTWHQSGLVPLVPYSWRLLGFSGVALDRSWGLDSASMGRPWRRLGHPGTLGTKKKKEKLWNQM